MIATSGQYIFTVSEVNQFIKDLLDNVPPLQEVLLRGEISNYKLYPSGHHYISRFVTYTILTMVVYVRSKLLKVRISV